MENLINVLIILGGLFVVYLLLKKEIVKTILENKDSDSQKFLDLSNKLIEGFNILHQRFDQHLQSTIEKQEKILESASKVEELTRKIESSTDELKTFKEILAGPKNRGYLGEIMLKEILKNLPSSFYEEQYQLGFERVDYVLKLNDSIIPIDSKFPIQNFHKLFTGEEKDKINLKKDLIRKLKDQIESINRKYISPHKGTVEYALMYLANEGIYYELLSDKEYEEVWDFAREKSVFITSPKTFELICSALLLIIRKQEFAQNIHQILNNLHQLEKDLIELKNQFEKSYKQLEFSYNNIREFEKIFNKFIINYRSLITTEQRLEEKVKEKNLL